MAGLPAAPEFVLDRQGKSLHNQVSSPCNPNKEFPMLDKIDLTQSLKKSAYKPVRKAQLERIFDLSELIYEQKRPVIIVFEGWDASGKGTTIRQLTQRLDARGYKVLATQAPRTHEQRKPWLWRFWMNIPRHGQI